EELFIKNKPIRFGISIIKQPVSRIQGKGRKPYLGGQLMWLSAFIIFFQTLPSTEAKLSIPIPLYWQQYPLPYQP
ncbi:hypothetical protein, partial [Enterocloster clostridioformis]|uniref:hypothetical protein n=2 Tax=Enterocloster clostridioformis TaxID=1531 RepID=UPI001A9BFA01